MEKNDQRQTIFRNESFAIYNCSPDESRFRVVCEHIDDSRLFFESLEINIDEDGLHITAEGGPETETTNIDFDFDKESAAFLFRSLGLRLIEINQLDGSDQVSVGEEVKPTIVRSHLVSEEE